LKPRQEHRQRQLYLLTFCISSGSSRHKDAQHRSTHALHFVRFVVVEQHSEGTAAGERVAKSMIEDLHLTVTE
jgi:hypothetical protein